MRPIKKEFKRLSCSRHGFTLVEMMVAVALVLLMMVMFAEVFTLATGTMSKQKSISELDQRQRTISTILRTDLLDRTFYFITPFHRANAALSLTDPGYIDPTQRRGYFYISENDIDNDVDDVLQFTVQRKDGRTFFGKTRSLIAIGTTIYPRNLNQPEYDDGDTSNGIGTSEEAEISYFVRNGILYRRVLLIRNPILGGDEQPLTNPDPTAMPPVTPVRLFQPGLYPGSYNAPGASTYPNDFDFSATFDFAAKQITVLGDSKLDNSVTDQFSLGLLRNRFGFNPISGQPLEFLPSTIATDPPNFLGRFTHEETSHSAFGWPGDPCFPNAGTDGVFFTMDDRFGTATDTNPYTRTNLTLSPAGVVQVGATPVYQSGPRQGEDMLLANVIGFDIKVWDPRGGPGPDGKPGLAGIDDDGLGGVDDAYGELGAINSDDGAWVDIGSSSPYGFYSQANNWNSGFGPLGSNNRCFDTWHPDQGGIAPFAFQAGRDGKPGVATVDDDMDGTVDNASELGTKGSDDVAVPRLKGIQIRVRYRDITSDLIREFTINEQLLVPDALGIVE